MRKTVGKMIKKMRKIEVLRLIVMSLFVSILVFFGAGSAFAFSGGEDVFTFSDGKSSEDDTYFSEEVLETTEQVEESPLTMSEGEEKIDVRYPNKLTPKEPANIEMNKDDSGNVINTNKGEASSPSKARASLTENVDNGNGKYPVHRSTDEGEANIFAADARQFITFKTKNGKTFHLVINHDEEGENVLLLTEVSEDDLLNMVEKKEEPAVSKEDTSAEKEKTPAKEEKKSSSGSYLLLFLVALGALGAGYYFKVAKKKEADAMKDFEKDEESYTSEAKEEDSETSEGSSEEWEGEVERQDEAPESKDGEDTDGEDEYGEGEDEDDEEGEGAEDADEDGELL